MVRIRMQRLGRRNRPFYRINAIEKRTRRDGKVLENLGWYDPVARDPSKQLSLKEERIRHWLSVGAQPSDTVRDFLAKANLIDVAEWEADRKRDRDRVTCKSAVARTEAALASLTEVKDGSEADLTALHATATAAVQQAKDAVSKADAESASAAISAAEGALASAKDAAAKAKAEAEAREAAAKAKAEAEAAAAAASAASEAPADAPAEG